MRAKDGAYKMRASNDTALRLFGRCSSARRFDMSILLVFTNRQWLHSNLVTGNVAVQLSKNTLELVSAHLISP